MATKEKIGFRKLIGDWCKQDKKLNRRTAKDAYKALVATVVEHLEEGKLVRLPGIGTLYMLEVKGRRLRRKATDTVVECRPFKTIHIKAAHDLKRHLNKERDSHDQDWQD